MEEVEDKAVHVQEEDKVVPEGGGEESETSTCLLYTSDAADE